MRRALELAILLTTTFMHSSTSVHGTMQEDHEKALAAMTEQLASAKQQLSRENRALQDKLQKEHDDYVERTGKVSTSARGGMQGPALMLSFSLPAWPAWPACPPARPPTRQPACPPPL